jgi:hypothetical protein
MHMTLLHQFLEPRTSSKHTVLAIIVLLLGLLISYSAYAVFHHSIDVFSVPNPAYHLSTLKDIKSTPAIVTK